MKRLILCAGIGVFSLLAGLLWNLPAAQAVSWFGGERPPVSGVHGHLSGGTVQQIQIGKQSIGPLNWQLSGLPLLWLQASAHVELQDPVLARGEVHASPWSGLVLSDWRATGSVSELMASAGYKFLPVRGQIGVKLDQAGLDRRRVFDVVGSADLIGLVWSLGSQSYELGDFHADLAPVEGAEVAQLSDAGGPVELNGEARLEADGHYDWRIRLRPRSGADPRLVNLMRGLGRPDPQGYYLIQQKGQLPQ